jgi:hypothetical protein
MFNALLMLFEIEEPTPLNTSRIITEDGNQIITEDGKRMITEQ